MRAVGCWMSKTEDPSFPIFSFISISNSHFISHIIILLSIGNIEIFGFFSFSTLLLAMLSLCYAVAMAY